LVAWEKVYLSKYSRGLGFRDPKKLSKVMGAKMWWRWIQGGEDLWKRIWNHKYCNGISITSKFFSQGNTMGSSI